MPLYDSALGKGSSELAADPGLTQPAGQPPLSTPVIRLHLCSGRPSAPWTGQIIVTEEEPSGKDLVTPMPVLGFALQLTLCSRGHHAGCDASDKTAETFGPTR